MPSTPEIQMFKSDFIPLLDFFYKIERNYYDEEISKRNLGIFFKYAHEFAKKYPAFEIKVEQQGNRTPRLSILLNGFDLKKVIEISEQQIPSISSAKFVMGKKYITVSYDEFKLYYSEYESRLENEFFLIFNHDGITRNVEFQQRKDLGKLQIVHDNFMLNPNDPHFHLCLAFALEKGYDQSINLSSYTDFYIGKVHSDVVHFRSEMGNKGLGRSPK